MGDATRFDHCGVDEEKASRQPEVLRLDKQYKPLYIMPVGKSFVPSASL